MSVKDINLHDIELISQAFNINSTKLAVLILYMKELEIKGGADE